MIRTQFTALNLTLTLILGINLALIGCGSNTTKVPRVVQPVTLPPSQETSPPVPQTSADAPQEPIRPTPEGWSEVIMNANWAKTVIDKMAHFTTNRNACGRETYGAIPSSDDWDPFVKNINLGIASALLTQERCTPSNQELDENGYYKKSMDGTVDIKLEDGSKRMLYETRDSDTCTTIQDPKVSSDLLSLLNKIVLIADKEDCPNGWGSALEGDSVIPFRRSGHGWPLTFSHESLRTTSPR